MTDTLATRLEAVFSRWVSSDAPGLIVGAKFKGDVIFRRGYGMASLESRVANSPVTKMRIGSTTKHFTSVLALLLAEEGKLDLDAPIRTYMPELKGISGDPTLREILRHRSGLHCSADLGFLYHDLIQTDGNSWLPFFASQNTRSFPRGTAMLYGNFGYGVASTIVERVGGAILAEQMQERLFEPLGMIDTEMLLSDMEICPGIATFHVQFPDGRWKRGIIPETRGVSEGAGGGGAVVSTIDDMFRWIENLRSESAFGLKAGSWQAMFELPRDPNGEEGNYAFGLMIDNYRGVRAIHHAGMVIGGLCQMLTVPEHELDIIIMTNGAPEANPIILANRIVDEVLKDVLGPPPSTVPAESYPAVPGFWWSPETTMVYRLVDHEGKLSILPALRGEQGWPLEQDGTGRILMRPYQLGQIELDLSSADAGTIQIKFGPEDEIYSKLDADDDAEDRFFANAAGAYQSPEGSCIAVIAKDDDGIFLKFQDSLGEQVKRVTVLSPDVAWFDSLPETVVAVTGCLTLKYGSGGVDGFTLNTMLSRRVPFTKISDPNHAS